MNSLDLVREFHDAFDQDSRSAIHVRDRELNRLRLRLLSEELCELAEALGFRLNVTEEREDLAVDPVAAIDALTDLQYVLDGAYLSLGFAHLKGRALLEVHRSNMSKLDSNGQPVKRDDGKILKGPNYRPPDLAGLLKRERVATFADAFSDEDPTTEYDTCVVSVPLEPASSQLPNTWAATLGEEPIEIAVARTDSAEFPNLSGEACPDCAAPHQCLHRSGCPYTILVMPPESEVA